MKDEDIEMRFKTESFRVSISERNSIYPYICAFIFLYIYICGYIYIIKTPVHHCSGEIVRCIEKYEFSINHTSLPKIH